MSKTNTEKSREYRAQIRASRPSKKVPKSRQQRNRDRREQRKQLQNKLKLEDDNQSVDSPAQSNPGTPRNDQNDDIALVSSTSCYPTPQTNASGSSRQHPKPKYSQLLAIIEELGKDIRPTYAVSRSSAERLKRGIVHARILVRECLIETSRNAGT